MSVSTRRVGTLALAGLAALGTLGGLESTAHAQRRPVRPVINPAFYPPLGLSPAQAAYNTAVIGDSLASLPPYLAGYNPYAPYGNYGPGLPAITPYAAPAVAYSPYAYNPYSAGATLSTGYGSGYGLSTAPYGLGSAAAYGANPYLNGIAWGGWGGYGGYGYGSNYSPAAGELYGTAAVIASTGDYYKSIMQARLTREQARQAAIETRRQLLREEIEAERMRPRAIDVIRREQATDLALARGNAPAATVWSGRALNDLLHSINKSKKNLTEGPRVPLGERVLEKVNLVSPGFKGQTRLLKGKGKLTWPTVLRDDKFDEARDNFSKKFQWAVGQLEDGEKLKASTVGDLRAALNQLNKQVSESNEELSPSQYIEARRHLNQLEQAVRALDDPNVGKVFSNAWKAKGNTVAELVRNMNGLEFAPASPGQEGAYNELYQALRAFEAGMQTAARPRSRDME
jgi:hypothetical protein